TTCEKSVMCSLTAGAPFSILFDSQCNLKESNCMSEALAGVLKNLWSNVTAIWSLVVDGSLVSLGKGAVKATTTAVKEGYALSRALVVDTGRHGKELVAAISDWFNDPQVKEADDKAQDAALQASTITNSELAVYAKNRGQFIAEQGKKIYDKIM